MLKIEEEQRDPAEITDQWIRFLGLKSCQLRPLLWHLVSETCQWKCQTTPHALVRNLWSGTFPHFQPTNYIFKKNFWKRKRIKLMGDRMSNSPPIFGNHHLESIKSNRSKAAIQFIKTRIVLMSNSIKRRPLLEWNNINFYQVIFPFLRAPTTYGTHSGSPGTVFFFHKT